MWIETYKCFEADSRVGVTGRAGGGGETPLRLMEYVLEYVTPRAGVWIETLGDGTPCESASVTPRAGVWIETYWSHVDRKLTRRHSPCGSVD